MGQAIVTLCIIAVHGRLIAMHGRLIGVHAPLIAMHGDLIGVHGKLFGVHGPLIGMHGRLITKHGRLITMHGRLIALHGRPIAVHGRLLGGWQTVGNGFLIIFSVKTRGKAGGAALSWIFRQTQPDAPKRIGERLAFRSMNRGRGHRVSPPVLI